MCEMEVRIMWRFKVVGIILLVISFGFPISGFAQEDLTIAVGASETCGDASLEITVQGGEAPYKIVVNFGDDVSEESNEISAFPYSIHHLYPSQGEYEYSVKVYGSGNTEGEAEGMLTITGPNVVLESNPSPPLLPLGSEGTKIEYEAVVSGGQEPYVFEWDLNEDGLLDESADPSLNTASFTYTEAVELEAKVKVTDACGFSEEDELSVFIVDPFAEEEPDKGEIIDEGEDPSDDGELNEENGCHPMAQRIANALNTLSPDQREGQYTCENIFNFFQGEEGGLQHSFGLLWRAYQMTQIIDELTWEDILDWHLEGNGWGVLQQLNRFAESLDEVGIAELYERVMSGDSTIGDIRSALKAAIRFEASFEDALGRLENGTSPGELNQLYRTAMEMEIEPELLDGYLEMGVSLSEIKCASRLADQTGSEWQILLGAYASGYDWGEIRKAFRLADETTDFETILAIGTDAYREQQRELERIERDEEQDERTAKRLAEQYGVTEEDVFNLLNSSCEGDWTCVRDQLREQSQENQNSETDQKIAGQIAEKYGVLGEDVWNVYNGSCEGDWGCVRGYFRDQSKKEHGNGTR